MAEFDLLTIKNPTSEDFTVNYNGEPYSIKAGEAKPFVHSIARHIAKYLSDKILDKEFQKKRTETVYKNNPKLRENDPERTQYTMLDNPQRRIALYTILESKTEIERTIKTYPQFRSSDTQDNFVGDISVYDAFVASYHKPKAPKTGIGTTETSSPKEVTT